MIRIWELKADVAFWKKEAEDAQAQRKLLTESTTLVFKYLKEQTNKAEKAEQDLAALRAELADRTGERDAYMQSYDLVSSENAALRARVEALGSALRKLVEASKEEGQARADLSFSRELYRTQEIPFEKMDVDQRRLAVACEHLDTAEQAAGSALGGGTAEKEGT